MTKLAKVLFVSFLFSLPTRLSAFELKHSEGIVKLAAPPQIIVSYDLAILDSLHYLQIPVAGMPDVRQREPFQKYGEMPSVGSLFEPDYDALNSLKPDLIFASRRTQDKLSKLNQVAPAAYLSTAPGQFLSDFKSHHLHLAKAFSKEAEVEPKLAAIEEDLTKLHQLNQGRTAALLMVFNDRKIISQGAGDVMAYAFEVLGLSVVPTAKPEPAAQAKAHQAHSPKKRKQGAAENAYRRHQQQLQAIAEANPDWLLVMDRQQMRTGKLQADAIIQAHPVLGNMDAVVHKRVLYLDPARWYLMRGGLDNLHQLITTTSQAMQGD